MGLSTINAPACPLTPQTRTPTIPTSLTPVAHSMRYTIRLLPLSPNSLLPHSQPTAAPYQVVCTPVATPPPLSPSTHHHHLLPMRQSPSGWLAGGGAAPSLLLAVAAGPLRGTDSSSGLGLADRGLAMTRFLLQCNRQQGSGCQWPLALALLTGRLAMTI